MNVLILTNHIKNYGGSEIQAHEIYRYFKSKGNQVKIYSNEFGMPMMNFFDIEDCVTDVSLIKIQDFDFVWVQHAIFSRLFYDKSVTSLKISIVSVHLSPFELLELSSLPYMSKLDVTFVANSEETRDKLIEFNLDPENIIISNNASPNEFITNQDYRVLKKILVISNHPPQEVLEAVSVLRKQGYTVIMIGRERKERVTPELIAGSNVIITIGKSVQYGILANISVYCYDHFGGPGYLDKNNFLKAKHFNFSGRGFGKKSSDQIVSEIIFGYDNCYKFINEIEDKTPFQLNSFMSDLLKKVRVTQLNENEISIIRTSFPIEEYFSKYYLANQHMSNELSTLKKRIRILKPLLKIENFFRKSGAFFIAVPYVVKKAGSVGKALQQSRRIYKRQGLKSLGHFWNQMVLHRRNALLEPKLTIKKIDKSSCLTILTRQHTYYIAKLIKQSLDKVGINSQIIFDIPASGYSLDWHIVICPQLFYSLPKFYYAFQMEQSVSSRWFTEDYFNRLYAAKAVFDYSLNNIEFLQQNGVPFSKLFYMPIGLLPEDKRQVDQGYDYDVAFYGDINSPRRKLFLEKIEKKFKTKIINEVFGEELKTELAKAKIVINIHYYENALLETTRIYECLSLNSLVISEISTDQYQHSDLEAVVDFIEMGNIDQMIQRIDFWLSHQDEFEKKIALIENYRKTPDKFQFYFYRFLLSEDIIDFETFYSLCADYVMPNNDFWCLSLPESIERRKDFDRDNKFCISVIPGLRHSIGWVGCGLSYKFMMRRASDLGLHSVTICEDDVQFFGNFEERYVKIKDSLNNSMYPWDIFSGLIADLSEEVGIEKAEINIKDERIYKTSHMVSTVCNIYNKQVYQKLIAWDENNRDIKNTIDRYIETSESILGLVVSPFLVGHKENLNSTLWGIDNARYSEMISKSQLLLDKKIEELEE